MPTTPITTQYDVVILADMTRQSDCGLRIRNELRVYQQLGFKAGLRHLPQPGKAKALLPEVDLSIREGLATRIGADELVHTRLAIVFSPGTLKEPATGLAGLSADKVVLVHDRVPNQSQLGLWFSFNLGPMTWAPTNRWVRTKIEELGYPVSIEAEDWRSIGTAIPARPTTRSHPSERIVVGRLSGPGAAQWPKTLDELKSVYPSDPGIDFRTIGQPPSDLLKDRKVVNRWTILDTSDTTIERFIEALDVFAYFPSAAAPELPEAAIASAMASGKVVALPPHLRPHFGPGALYCEPGDAVSSIKALFEDEAALDELRKSAQYHAGFQFSETTHTDKVKQLIGDPPPKRRYKSRKTKRKERILFVPSNGIGLGHAARLLAIARRLDEDVEPVFTSFGQATKIIESFGYTAEYIPSHGDIGANIKDWDGWLRYEMGEAIRRHQPAMVVYDGNNPTPGLVHAALADGRCHLAWVRRAMCPSVPSPFLENSRFFDCIIEPGEYAGELDTGPTAARRSEAIVVPPIRLLDESEVLPRLEAMERLGLDPTKPAVLLHLGGGANRDVVDLINRVVFDLRQFETLQIIIAEWSNAAERMPHWPGTKVLRGFPISQFFNAFDFSIAAAGYNTYHEVLGFGLPTIFIANRHPSMDNQAARAEFAQEKSAGFDLNDDEMHLLPVLCEAMLTKAANDFVRQQCATFDKTNGAGEAASILKRMVFSQ